MDKLLLGKEKKQVEFLSDNSCAVFVLAAGWLYLVLEECFRIRASSGSWRQRVP